MAVSDCGRVQRRIVMDFAIQALHHSMRITRPHRYGAMPVDGGGFQTETLPKPGGGYAPPGGFGPLPRGAVRVSSVESGRPWACPGIGLALVQASGAELSPSVAVDRWD
jgi:hypothetical protein